MLRHLVRQRWFQVVAVVVLLGTPTAWLMARSAADPDASIVARVKRGDFKVAVKTSGELRAPKFVQINVPANANQAGQYQMKIQSIIPEGSIVKAGEVVAELDRSTIAMKMADVQLALTKAEAQNEQASLDSTLNLSKAREDMRTAALTLEEKKLAKEQSAFEAPSVRRQAELDYEKVTRKLRQDSMDLRTKTEQAQAKMREVGTDLARQRNLIKAVMEVMAEYTIKAPAPGMVIYVKDWNGKKRGVGTMVSSWEGTVATLPDLSQMESITFVNEIDVRKLAVGQPVVVTLDADPTKQFRGTVTAVGNVGEQRPNSDAKVFEVKVSVEKPDTTLRPGMTTGNAIETYTEKNVLFVPLEAVTSDSGVPVVFRRSGPGVVKQEVEAGAMNDDEIVIVRGLEEGDRVLLLPPANRDELKLVRLPGSKAPKATNAPPTPAKRG